MIYRIIPVLLIISSLASPAYAAQALFGASPDNGLPLVLRAIKSAKQELIINMYEFQETAIGDAVLERIEAGIAVKLLMEGSPFSGLTPKGHRMMEVILHAMKAKPNDGHEFRVMGTPAAGKKRRFVFDHAKYMVIDRTSAYISSENFSEHNYPVPGNVGNRGWHVWVNDSAVALDLAKLYAADATLTFGDIHDTLATGWLPPLSVTSESPSPLQPRPVPSIPGGSGAVRASTLIAAPGAGDKMVSLIGSARKKVGLQFMSLPALWYRGPGESFPNPLVQALLARALAGVQIRVILNDDRVFSPKPGSKLQNMETVCILMKEAKTRKLPIEAALIDVKALGISYIHNKGILVDDSLTLVSSVNGTQNSIIANRELGIVLDSPAATRYFGKIFDFDWTKTWHPTEEQCKNPTAP